MATDKDNTHYDLYYYNTRGFTEPIRMLLSYGGADFSDNRAPITSFNPITPLPTEWREHALFGQVPMLEFEGKILTQSLAITRYLARKYKLVGADDFEAAKCDEIVDGTKDFFQVWIPSYMENDPKKKQDIYRNALEVSKQRYFPKFHAILESNGGKHLVGDGLTWADIYLANYFDHLTRLTKINILEDYPLLQNFTQTILATPGIKEWMEKRPNTPA